MKHIAKLVKNKKYILLHTKGIKSDANETKHVNKTIGHINKTLKSGIT